MKITENVVEKAYKKLKSSVYYDKTQLILRNKIVEFEQEHKGEELDKYLRNKIFNKLRDEKEFLELIDTICNKISVISLPKKLQSIDTDIIINSSSKKVSIQELQYYINMPVEGHILGVLWIMLLGYRIDNSIYEHSYGNRIRKNLINEFSNELTYSPYLFEPYFEQYESWRDRAMDEAQKHMKEKQDVAIITMDFRRYYYSLDIDENVMKEMLESVIEQEDSDEYVKICKALHMFISKVIIAYAGKFSNFFNNRKILPIGFLPSNIIGNWCLQRFDKAIVDGWNPVYYGRYVDDILIVDKIERNSELCKKAQNNDIHRNDIIQFFLTSCSKWNGLGPNACKKADKYAVIQASEEDRENYLINPIYNPVSGNKSEIVVHNDKVKIFYFKWDESDALITCFRSNISKNKSEFRHLPEDEAVFQRDDYSDIYALVNNDTVNKFRGVEKISIDKYELSKFLGKYLRIGGMIYDKVESRFEKDILKIFNSRAIIENYTMWEKIIEILTINERFDALESFCERINQAIKSIEIVDSVTDEQKENVSDCLYSFLHACLCRSFGLVWKKAREKTQKAIYEAFLNEKIENLKDNMVQGYCNARMIDKTVMPIIYEMLDPNLLNLDSEVNLTKFEDVFCLVKDKWSTDYKYYPYIVSMYDFSMVSCIEQMNLRENDSPYNDLPKIQKEEYQRYIKANYPKEDDELNYRIDMPINVHQFLKKENVYEVNVGNEKKSILRLAIANVRLNHINFERIVKNMPDRRYARYKELSQIVNLAIDQKADMLIMPEAYVPFEWLPILARTASKNNLAIITGVEHIKHEDKVFNYTATILPYLEDTHKCANITFHLKKHYAPSEVEKIEGYRLKPITGKNYELYKWNDCYFSVYCCYELTSIIDRSLFQSYADMLIAVEWNRDVKYYSNILESLSRDLHCYCIQVNSSEYGDSRITKPSRSEEKDMIRTKGGINSSILVEDINISELRDFQLKEYSLQQKSGKYKVTPPNFDKEVVLKKIKGENI